MSPKAISEKKENKLAMLAKELNALAQSSETALEICSYWDARRRFREYTNIRLLRKQMRADGKRWVDSEANEFFEDLVKLDVGHIKQSKAQRKIGGTEKNPEFKTVTEPHFMWHYNICDVAEMAMTGKPNNARVIGAAPKTSKAPKLSKKVEAGIKSGRTPVEVDENGTPYIRLALPKEFAALLGKTG